MRLLDGRYGFVHPAHLSHLREKTADNVCDTALSLLGVPYRFGGRSAVALDCSGLVSLSFGACGITLARNTRDLSALPTVSPARARRGDLVLFDGHVGLLLTRTAFVHASAAVGFVHVASLNSAHPLYDKVHCPHGYTFRRVL